MTIMALVEQVKISNICSTAILNSKLCRETIKSSFPFIKYPVNFSGGILKYPDGCLLVFDSGKINVTGIRNITTAYTLIDRFCNNYPHEIKLSELKIVNIAAYTKMNPSYNFEKLKKMPYYSYEPELFPGIHVKVDKSKVIFIIFRSGRIIATGIKKLESVEDYFNMLLTKLYKADDTHQIAKNDSL